MRQWLIEMNNILSKSVAALFFALSAYSCTVDSTVSPPSDSEQMIPLRVGNQWTYADSILTSSGNFAGSYTVTVTDRIDTLGRSWWQIDNIFNPSIASNYFTLNGNSIFSLQATKSVIGMAPILSLEYVRPTGDDTIRYQALYDGDAFITKVATRLAHQYSATAGVFDNCIVFTYDITREHYQEIVSPGIGMIALEVQADSILRVSPAWQRSIRLIDHQVQK